MEIKLKKPLEINGEKIEKISMNFDEISALDYCKASAAAQKKTGADAISFAEFDSAFHLYIGFFAIMAGNKKIALFDLEKQIKGADLLIISREARNFFMSTIPD